MTSADLSFVRSRGAKIEEKASVVEAEGTGAVTERGLWREKKDATWTSGSNISTCVDQCNSKHPYHDDVDAVLKVRWAAEMLARFLKYL